MPQIILKEWNGRKIKVREDRYVCLTDMAQACDKLLGNWTRLDGTKSYLETLSAAIHIGITELIQVKQGGTPEEQGTYGHPKVALRLAQWLSNEFAVQVDIWLDELLTNGVVSLNPPTPLSMGELVIAMGQSMVKQERLEAEHRKLEAEHGKLALIQAKQQEQVDSNTLGVSETRQELTALKAAMLDLRSTVANYQAGTNLTQTPRNMLNELVQKLGAVLALKDGTSVGEAIRRVWAQISLRLRNSNLHFDLEARAANAKRSYEAAVKQWQENGSRRGQKPKALTRVDLLEDSGIIKDALDVGIGLAQAV